MKTITSSLLLFVFCGLTLPTWGAETSISGLPAIATDTIRVFLVRHGETVHNITANISPDSPEYNRLTEKGEAQAKALGPALKEQPIVGLFCSETERTKRTMQLSGLAEIKNLEIKIVPDFNRMALGVTDEGKPYTMNQRIEIGKQGSDPRPKDGESLSDAVKRFVLYLRSLKTAYGKAVVVATHGDVIGGIAGSAEGIPPWERWEKYQADLGSITVVDVVDKSPLILRVFNYSTISQ